MLSRCLGVGGGGGVGLGGLKVFTGDFGLLVPAQTMMVSYYEPGLMHFIVGNLDTQLILNVKLISVY